MHQALKFFCGLIVAVSSANICIGQSTTTAPNSQTSVRFVDTDGQPVSPETALFFDGVLAETIAVEKGVGVAPGQKGIVVATTDGFQLTGCILSGSEAKIVFRRDDEPCELLTQTAYPLNDEIKTKIIDRIKETLWENVKDQPAKSMETLRTVRVLAAVDPLGTLQWLDANNLPVQTAGIVLQPALNALLSTDPEEAFDRCSQVKDPIMQSALLMYFLSALDPDAPALKAVEAQILEVTRGIKQPAVRLGMRSVLAEHFLFTEQRELADKIVQQHIEDVKQLPVDGWTAFVRSNYAALVVENDPELAQELIEGPLDGQESYRAHSRVAFSCCRTNPELAMKLLSLVELPEETIVSAVENPIKMCHRMAVEQTEAARKLAATIDELNARAWALGLMAMELNEPNPQLAKQLFAEATELLSQPEARDRLLYPVSETLAGLLPIAQEVDPTKVRPIIWQAVLETLVSNSGNDINRKVRIQSVAGAIARYDLELGRALIGDSEIVLGYFTSELETHQALLKPSGLLELTAKICALDPVENNYTFDRLTDLVTQSESEFWKSVSRPSSLAWPIQKFEEMPR